MRVGMVEQAVNLHLHRAVCALPSPPQGVLRGFDQAINLILDECHERVYSTKVSCGLDYEQTHVRITDVAQEPCSRVCWPHGPYQYSSRVFAHPPFRPAPAKAPTVVEWSSLTWMPAALLASHVPPSHSNKRSRAWSS